MRSENNIPERVCFYWTYLFDPSCDIGRQFALREEFELILPMDHILTFVLQAHVTDMASSSAYGKQYLHILVTI